MIIPIRLELYNIFQHKEYIHDYRPEVLGVTGHNGAGKTHFLHDGQMLGWTGALAGQVRYTKKDVVRWGCKTGRTRFTFRYVADGQTYCIERHLPGSKQVLQQLDPEGNPVPEQEWTQKEAQGKMDEFLDGCSADLLHELVFVEQGSLLDLARGTNASRLDYFSKLAGTYMADTYRRQLQDHITAIPAAAIDEERERVLQESIPELEKQLEASTARRDKAQQEEELLHQDLLLVERVFSLPTETEVQNRRIASDLKLETAQAEAKAFLDEHESDLEELEEVPDITDVERRQHAAVSELAKCEAYLDKAETDLKGAEASQPVAAGDTEVEAEELENARDVRARLEPKKKLLTLDPGCPCPTCGSIPDITEEQQEEIRKELAQAEADVAAAAANLKDAQELCRLRREAREMWAREVAQHRASVERLTAQKTELTELLKGYDAQAYERKSQARQEYLKRLRSQRELLQQSHQLTTAIDAAEAEVAKWKGAEFATRGQLEEAEEVRDAYAKAKAAADEYVAEAATLAATLKSHRQEVEAVAAQRQKQQRADELREALTETKDLFHRDQLPRCVLQPLIEHLNIELEYFLQLFQVPFSAHLDDAFDFRVSFPDQEDAAARTALSGGQCVVLSLAFRFAALEVLRCPLPMLILDEPTVYLDDASEEALVTAIQALRPAVGKGMHIMISTHDHEVLSSAFDAEIKFSRAD